MNTIETNNTRLAMLADTAWPRWRGDRLQPWSVIGRLAESTVLVLLTSCLLPWRGEWLVELPDPLAVAGILCLCVAWIVRRGMAAGHGRASGSQALQANEACDQQLREQTAQLLAANRELEAFACSVSHDLRAPLRAVDGFARILQEDYAAQLDETGRRALGIICDESQRMGRLISDLLEFSRVGQRELRRTEVDMATLVREQFKRLQEAGAGRDLEFRVNELPPVQADPALLRQVWSNLLDNALKYTRHTPRAEICIEGSKQGNEIIYSIRDNGAGFDMRYAGKLFGMFQRLHTANEFEGTGVGLASAQRIIQRHGGRIWAAAQVGRGATFSFSLPDKVQGKATAARLCKIPTRTAEANLKAPRPRASVPGRSPRWRFPFPASDRGD